MDQNWEFRVSSYLCLFDASVKEYDIMYLQINYFMKRHAHILTKMFFIVLINCHYNSNCFVIHILIIIIIIVVFSIATTHV